MKKFFLFTVLVFSSFFAFAGIDLIPGEGAKPRHFLQVEFAQNTNRGNERNKTHIAGEYGFNFMPFFGFAGVQADEDIFDIVLRTEWLPFVFNSDKGEWRFGANSSYHFQKNSGYYDEHDFIFETSVYYKTKKNFLFKARFGYSCRLTYFAPIKNFHITEHDATIVNEIDKIWRNGCEVFFALSSYSNFRYPLFFCPQFTLGFGYNFTEDFRLAAQIDWGDTEIFASVLHVNYGVVRLSARVSF